MNPWLGLEQSLVMIPKCLLDSVTSSAIQSKPSFFLGWPGNQGLGGKHLHHAPPLLRFSQSRWLPSECSQKPTALPWVAIIFINLENYSSTFHYLHFCTFEVQWRKKTICWQLLFLQRSNSPKRWFQIGVNLLNHLSFSFRLILKLFPNLNSEELTRHPQVQKIDSINISR